MTRSQITAVAVVAGVALVGLWLFAAAPGERSNVSRQQDEKAAAAPEPNAAGAAAPERRDASEKRGANGSAETAGAPAGESAASAGDEQSGETRRAGQATAGAARRERARRRREAPELTIDTNVAGQPRAARLPERQLSLPARLDGAPPTPAAGAPLLSDLPASEGLYDSGELTQFASNEQVEVERPGRIEGASGTILFDLKPQWDEAVGYADFVALGDSAKVTKLGNLLQFEIIDAGNVRHVVTARTDEWEPDEAQQIAATWDEKQLYLYVNGRLASTDGIEHPIQIDEEATLRIGSRYPDGRPIAPATISRIRLRDKLFVPAAPAAMP